MARTRGRVIIAKVDQQGKRIKGKLADWIKTHPSEMYFDSMPEYEVWDYMQTNSMEYESKTELILFDTCDTKEFKNDKLASVKQRNIKYTPDYYLPEYDTYIEVKGYADELFKMRWKLFKLSGYTGYIVYSLKDFVAVLKLLKKSTT